MTEAKLSRLHKKFPSCDTECLLDILVSCDGSCEKVEAMLGCDPSLTEAFSNRSVKRAKTQQTLGPLLGSNLQTRRALREQKTLSPISLFTKEEIEQVIPYCTYHTQVLPSHLAESILRHVMNDKGAKPNEFYLFGNKCTSTHRTRIYFSTPPSDVYHYSGKTVTDTAACTDEMVMAQILIEDLVNNALKDRQVLRYQVKPGSWNVQTILANVYEKESDLDWHSDRLTRLGPHAIIASLSLGFSREFRVRRVSPPNSQVYSIKPAHNSLIIMHAGFQEEFKHCVPHLSKKQAIAAEDLHPISGAVRVNLTLRDQVLQFSPKCKRCGYPMDLRRTFKRAENRGKYIWQCSRSYTEESKLGHECNGMSFANFDNKTLQTDKESECAHWLASDDEEARFEQNRGVRNPPN
ncbi:LAMI_0F00408g1_1 [Lachancea mirantina]|uniref:LAMI_0F00408g1_1 n=1 Tax=Lachancea mirantina TaxID=1230905 RepID=A0A1G4JVK9_9SACH|nr:LAMI_0F00408g1_1 [Lachancea mirantina]